MVWSVFYLIKSIINNSLLGSRHRPGAGGGMLSIAAMASIDRARPGIPPHHWGHVRITWPVCSLIGRLMWPRDWVHAFWLVDYCGGHVSRGVRAWLVAAWQRARSDRARPRDEPSRHASGGGAVHRAAGAAPPHRWVSPPARAHPLPPLLTLAAPRVNKGNPSEIQPARENCGVVMLVGFVSERGCVRGRGSGAWRIAARSADPTRVRDTTALDRITM